MWVNVEQNTDEWLALRAGKVGGSSISKIMANNPKAFGDPAHSLAVQLAIEQITGQAQEGNYSNTHMERGHEQEPIARALYEEEYFCDVTNGGFFDNGRTGVSPDGLVGDNGIIEIKSVIASVHFKTVKRGKLDPSYKWQVIFNLKESGRSWIDFVSFCSEFPPGKRLFVDRVLRCDCIDSFKLIDERLESFFDLVESNKEIICNINE